MPDLPKRKKSPKSVKKSGKNSTKQKKTSEYILTAQLWDKYLILDIFANGPVPAAGVWLRRHVTQIETGEYETYRPAKKTWSEEKLLVAELGTTAIWYDHIDIENYIIDQATQDLIHAAVPTTTWSHIWSYSENKDGCLREVMAIEDDYSKEKSEKKRESK